MHNVAAVLMYASQHALQLHRLRFSTILVTENWRQ